MEKKITKREVFEKVIDIVRESGVDEAEMLIEKLEHEIDLLNKKRKAKDYTEEMEMIYNALVECGKAVTVTELVRGGNVGDNVSAPKATALLTKLKNAGKVERTEEKGKAYYKAI